MTTTETTEGRVCVHEQYDLEPDGLAYMTTQPLVQTEIEELRAEVGRLRADAAMLAHALVSNVGSVNDFTEEMQAAILRRSDPDVLAVLDRDSVAAARKAT